MAAEQKHSGPTRHLPAISLMFAALLWGLLWWPLRYFNEQGISGLWSSVLTYCFAFIPGFWLIRKQLRFFWRYPVMLFLIAITSGWTNVSFIVAVAEKDAARMVLLFYLSPVWAILLGIVFLRERPTIHSLAVAVLALTGAILMLYNPYNGALWPRDFYDWLAISSGFSFAATNLFIRRLEHVPVVVKTFSSWIGVILVAFLWLLVLQTGQGGALNFPSISAGIWLGLIVLGLFGVTSMTLAVQYGVSRLPLFKSSIILVFEVVVTIISSLLLSHEQLLHLAPYGAVLIVLAAVLAGWTDNTKEIPAKQQ